MRILAAILLLTTTAFGQEGLDPAVGAGALPEGIAGVTDIKKVQISRIEALKDTVQELQARYDQGLDSIDFLLESQIELAVAQLDTTDDRQERLGYIQAAFNSALLHWQRVKELQKIGVRGGDAAAAAQAKALVFRFRVMWLKEKANAESKPMPQSLGAMTSGSACGNVYPCYVPNSCKATHGRAQPIIVHLVRRRPFTRRLQAVGVWQSHSALHCAAPVRLRTGT